MLKRKIKKCKICKSEVYIYKQGMCKLCSFKFRKDEEKQKEIKERTLCIHRAMYNFWEKSNKRCSCCNSKLPKDFCTYMVDHLLEKGVYPQFSLSEDNMYIVCFDCHNKKTNGYPLEKHKIAIKEAKIKLLKI